MNAVTLPYPTRVERLTTWLAQNALDCAVVFGADHVTHLAGYRRYFGGPAAVVVEGDGRRTLAVALDEAPIARELSSAEVVVSYGERGFGLDLDPLASLVPVVAGLDAVATSHRVGIASELAGAAERLGATAGSAELVSIADVLAEIRLRKDADELDRIAAAYRLCWSAHEAVARAAVPGVTEIELFAAAQSAAVLAAGTPIEFLSDLLSGPNAAEVCGPIRVPGARRLEPGDGVVADLVARLDGYWGDTAETHPVGDAPEIRSARAKLTAVLRATAAELTPGATGRRLFADMSRRILEAFPGGEFPHHGGHGVGLSAFEDPHVIPADETPLESGMVLAIEPGVYFPGRYGARVEEIFVVTDNGGVELRQAVESAVHGEGPA
jgi:Xaa-Pro aminopeptidase